MSRGKQDTRRHWDLHPAEARWFAVRTPARWEKEVTKRLAEKNIDVYLPLLSKMVSYAKQKQKKIKVPLINGFVFVKITEKEYQAVRETNGVAFFLMDAKVLRAIPEKEMDILRQVVGEKVAVRKAQFEIGEKVIVVGGNLTGLEGKLIERKGKKCLVVALMMLDKELLIEINPEHLRRK